MQGARRIIAQPENARATIGDERDESEANGDDRGRRRRARGVVRGRGDVEPRADRADRHAAGAHRRARPVAPKPALTEAAPVFAPPQPSLKLAGIAEDIDADGTPQRTAIISGEGQLYMAKEGESVTVRYRVTKISADVVELMDLATQTPRRLALR
jgi:hypothetical protein